VILLDGLEAAHPFQLSPGLRVRRIQRSELSHFAGTLMGGTPSSMGPRTDWWVCDARYAIPRGTAEGFNRVSGLLEPLAVAFHAFKSEKVTVGPAMTEQVEPFGSPGRILSSPLEVAFRAFGRSYELSRNEIPRFVRFWRALRPILEAETHYLQVPARRLWLGMSRLHAEDTLVDHVVGLEALLGLESERTELAYRFRVRGATVLARQRSERREHLRKLQTLYDLRSRIVHGQRSNPAEFGEALPYAETALRRIWTWYFNNWRDETDNRRALIDVDESLLGI
jgi:Apea-like HEPN